MKIMACASLPIISAKMHIAEMHNDGYHTIICEHESMQQGFWAPIPKHVAKKLKVGDTVTVVCIPTKDLSFATESLALIWHKEERLSEVLYDRDDYAQKLLLKK